MYKLVILDDEGHTTVVPLLRDLITIGRTEGNTIRLTERNVSRRHARLLKGNGSYIVEDLGSYNGVLVNGDRIDTRAKLSPGDQLGIGDYDISFQSDAGDTAGTVPSMRPKAEPPPRLVILGEPAAGAEFTLSKPVLRIGRDEHLDIWINHKSISHEHAEVQVDADQVTVFDLESVNGMRVNGIRASKAVLEAGDILELGEVRFRFLPGQGARSLAPLPEEMPAKRTPSPERKPLFALFVIGLLLLLIAGAVLTTMRSPLPSWPTGSFSETQGAKGERAGASEMRTSVKRRTPEPTPSTDVDEASEEGFPDLQPADEPQEWERQLIRARRALARGRVSRAYAIANELPADSVLRETPEFAEIRYRYAQAHIFEGQQALEDGNAEQAKNQALLVIRLDGITVKQRRDARRLASEARAALQQQPGPSGGQAP